MNVNLIRKFIQNSKKYNKIINSLLSHEGLCPQKFSRHNSTFIGLKTNNECLQSRVSSNWNTTQKRCYCQGEESGPPTPSHKLPPLMQFPPHVWPSLFKSLKNLILATFIIKPYFDPEFNIPDFVMGSKKAVEVVSNKLAKGEDLNGLVTTDIIPKLKEAVSRMTLGQRDLIPIKMEDIYFAFPYQIGIILEDANESEIQKRFVEITMVFHTLKDLAALRSSGEEPSLNVGMEHQDRMYICNYRFIKEFTKGVESEWTINLLNHFRPIEEES